MTREYLDTPQRLPMRNYLQRIMFPVAFSLLIALTTQAQTKPDSNMTSKPNLIADTEVIQDSVFIADIENILNTITVPRLPQSTREKLIKDILIKLEFFYSIPQEHIYMKRGNSYPQQATLFLNTFYKELYRDSGTLSVDISNISLEDNKLYVHFDYIYTPKEN